MDELRIPVMGREVVIEWADGVQAGGLVFVPTAAPDHDGAMRLVEWLNDSDAFFPFQAHGGSGSVLVNKRNVRCVTAHHESDSIDYDEINDALKLAVRVEMQGGSVDGHIVMDMPDNKLRVLDVLNTDKQFVFLLDGGREVHVNKRFIIKAAEVEKGQDTDAG
jgi:hypothetical protein